MLTGIGLARTIAEQSPLAARVAREPDGDAPTPAANPNIPVMTVAEKCPISSENTDLAVDLKSFLVEHTPFQAMSDGEMSDLAAGSTLVDFPAGAVVADYATRVPDDVWMVRSGQVTLQASADGTTIDTVEEGGIFGYTPLLTGGGMEFVARAVAPSTLIRLPGALVRAQFPGPRAWRSWRRQHGTPVESIGRRLRRRPTAGPSANCYTAMYCWSAPRRQCAMRCAG